MFKNTDVFAKPSKILHWLIALLVLGMLSGSFFLSDLPDSLKPTAYMIHKSIGLTVLGLMLIRVIAIGYYGRPALPCTLATWEVFLSRLIQHGFYGLLIVMPITGWIMSTASGRSPDYFGLHVLPFPGIAQDKILAHQMELTHNTLAYILLVFVFLHICGALKHLWIDRDDVFKKMWF